MNFKKLHAQDSPLLICNVWDVASAKAAEKLKFKAIGTSSGAMADMLGYKDGEEMSFGELVYMVKRITQSVNVPLTVDLEAGYSRTPAEIADHIIQLAHLGVVGINLEDSLINRLTTPLGPMLVCASEKGICLLEFTDRKLLETEFRDLQRLLNAEILYGENKHTKQLKTELTEYFAGKRQQFSTPLHMPGTDFQKRSGVVYCIFLTALQAVTNSWLNKSITLKHPELSPKPMVLIVLLL